MSQTPPLSSLVVQRRVEFSETDMAGILHFTNLFKYMELAEAELYEKAGTTLLETLPGQVVGWPRVRVQAEFHAPLRFRDLVEIHLFIKAIKIRAIEYAFWFFRQDPEGPTHIATGSMTTLAVTLDPATGQMVSRAIPENLLANLAEASPLVRPYRD
jgi:acyl-CoA thioester hydrolase